MMMCVGKNQNAIKNSLNAHLPITIKMKERKKTHSHYNL